jgi:5-methylcytosine-specific restriction endonuclease McrA
MNECKYGCGNEAKYVLKNGSPCCSDIHTKCPVNRKRNSKGLSDAYKQGKRQTGSEQYNSLSDDSKYKMSLSNKGKYSYDFSQNSKYTKGTKLKLIEERGHQCEICKNDVWLGNPITIEIDHIDGDRKNNTRENLRLVCPNCHAQSPTWRRKKTNIQYQKHSDEEILNAILSSKSMTQTLEKLDLRWNSYRTVLKIMKKNNIDTAIWM